MRISILLLPLLLFFTLQAQTPFAPVGAQWTYETGIWSGPDTNLLVVEVLSDTVIAGHTCGIMSESGAFIICHASPKFISNSNDSTFYWESSSNTHQLLFRWNSVPGDQWSTRITLDAYVDTVDWTVADTGHITIDGISLRTVSAIPNSRNSELFVEGQSPFTERLGDVSGPFRWTTGFCDAETFNGLRCYGDGNITWLNPQYAQCSLATEVPVLNAAQGFTIAPSSVQAGQLFTVTLPPGRGSANLRIRDNSGRIVIDRAPHGQAMLCLPHPGMYLVQMLGAGLPLAPQRLLVW